MMYQNNFNENQDIANVDFYQNTQKENVSALANQATSAGERIEQQLECAETLSKEVFVNQSDRPTRADNLIKHPLQDCWTFWYLENNRSKAWVDRLSEVASIDTVEDFWTLYYHIKTPSGLKPGSDYSFFKKGIQPMWEDAANKQGGRWVISLNRCLNVDLDNLWLDVVLCTIGGQFEQNKEICGAVINVRNNNNKLSIWTANGNNEQAILEIGLKLKEVLRLDDQHLYYQLHKDTMLKTDRTVESIYTL